MSDDAFLPVYLDRDGTSTREIELRFWSLAADDQHPDPARALAWGVIAPMIESGASTLPHLYCRLLDFLYSRPSDHGVAEVARPWVWQGIGTADPVRPSGEVPYYEIHAHFRGSIPFDHTWEKMMGNARARALLRKHVCKAGRWSRTRAELVQRAALLRADLATELGMSEGFDERMLRERWVYRLRALGAGPRSKRDEDAVVYLVLYANLRRFYIHQRGATGLVPFTKSFKLHAKASKCGPGRTVDQETVAGILRRFERSGAAVVELRPTLESKRIVLQRKMRNIVLGYFDYLRSCCSEAEPVTLGLVPSLFKQETLDRVQQWHGRTEDEALQRRLERQRYEWAHQVDVLIELIERVPALRLFIVGLDAAGLEQGAPVRELQQAFERVHGYHRRFGLAHARPGRQINAKMLRDHARRWGSLGLWERINDRGIGESPRRVSRCRLGLTVHVGEDFIDPVTGLREMWEAIEDLGLRKGDRIGHGIAASLRPNALRRFMEGRVRNSSFNAARQHGKTTSPRLRKPRGLHVLDLAWAERHLGGHAGALAGAIAHTYCATPLHHGVVMSLHEGSASTILLPGVHFCDHEQLAPEQGCWIDINDTWRENFETLRMRVINKLRARGIVVESCPTSNCAVANLEVPPIVHLLEEQRLRCGIATDDPGVLGAWPEHELSRLEPPQRARVLAENRRAAFVRP